MIMMVALKIQHQFYFKGFLQEFQPTEGIDMLSCPFRDATAVPSFSSIAIFPDTTGHDLVNCSGIGQTVRSGKRN